MLTMMATLLQLLRHRWRLARATHDAGYSTEFVLIAAGVAAAALVVVAIIVAKLTAKAEGIDFG